jgi:hypothetical protein
MAKGQDGKMAMGLSLEEYFFNQQSSIINPKRKWAEIPISNYG